MKNKYIKIKFGFTRRSLSHTVIAAAILLAALTVRRDDITRLSSSQPQSDYIKILLQRDTVQSHLVGFITAKYLFGRLIQFPPCVK